MQKMSAVGNTSRWVAAVRAAESSRTDALFYDRFAESLAGGTRFEERANGGANPYLVIRTKYFDDHLERVVNEDNIRQVVLLAAGLDARAFRFAWPPTLRWFEVDREEIFEHKQPILDRLDAVSPCERHVVVADLESDWASELLNCGFDPAMPSVFLVEGILVYLSARSVARIMKQLASVATMGSNLFVDVPGMETLTSPFMTEHLKGLEQAGCPWIFGVADPETFFAEFGWSVNVTTAGSTEANFGRWPYPIVPRSVPGVPRTYLITGKKTR